MTAIVIVGAQWGDEGKGKVVDLAAEHADVVVRYAGGPNAGHTLVVGSDKIVVRLVPSGILQPHTLCLMGQGMVVDPAVLAGELDALETRGIQTAGRLVIASLAHVIMPYHIVIDGLRESDTGSQKIGTTKKGIGPAYEDKVARRGIRVADLADPVRLRELVGAALGAWGPVAKALGGELPSVDAVLAHVQPFSARLLALAGDSSKLLDDAVRAKKRVLLEGAQGTLLDVDHGTYPFVTSSSAVSGGACTGSGIGPSRIHGVVGITKAYATRVGEGPFPTELFGPEGDRLRERGGEFGSVTGRPRRTGWLDLPALRYAARVNGVDGWAITKLDVLTGLADVQICVGYELDGQVTRDLPLGALAKCKPVYKAFPGWSQAIEEARSIADLPPEAQALVKFIESETEVPAYLVSVGPRRDQTIMVRDLFA
ncbi:MAG: adenylosuccinate synthase [Myxococcales bacterium]|nr:adenylosuccinate synthase [Myxococcales bacterium]